MTGTWDPHLWLCHLIHVFQFFIKYPLCFVFFFNYTYISNIKKMLEKIHHQYNYMASNTMDSNECLSWNLKAEIIPHKDHRVAQWCNGDEVSLYCQMVYNDVAKKKKKLNTRMIQNTHQISAWLTKSWSSTVFPTWQNIPDVLIWRVHTQCNLCWWRQTLQSSVVRKSVHLNLLWTYHYLVSD